MNISPSAAAFKRIQYVANSPVAMVEMCRALDMQVNPNSITLSIWKDGRLAGGTIYERFSKRAIFLHIVGFEPNWFNRKFLWLGFHYPFEQLGVDKVFGLVSANRREELAFFMKLGFVIETSIKEVYSDNADQLVLRLEKKDCKWLKLKEKPNGLV